MKEYKTKYGVMGLDCMLCRHVKEVVSNYTTYFLCVEDYIDSKNVKSESPHDTIIGVMVIDKNVVEKSQVNCIIHCMGILPKWCRKGYGKYLMVMVFVSDSSLENIKVYAVTRLIHDYTPSHYVELDSNYTEEDLCAQISYDLKDENPNVSTGIPSKPKFGK